MKVTLGLDNNYFNDLESYIKSLPNGAMEILEIINEDIDVNLSSLTTQEKARKLKEYIENLKGFEIVTELDGNYNNMGATIIDGILQAGMNYKTVVKPRVIEYLNKYPAVITTSDFASLTKKIPISELIKWKKDSAKTKRISGLISFFLSKNIETQKDLNKWLLSKDNISEFRKQDGIGDKTADYFKILSGHNNVSAIDRHLFNFLERAGIINTNYSETQAIISATAKLLNIDESYLDHSIWKYMSEL